MLPHQVPELLRRFFTFPLASPGGMAGALADRGVAGIERARERGGGGVSTELRGVVAGLRSSSRRAGILVFGLLCAFCVSTLVLVVFTRGGTLRRGVRDVGAASAGRGVIDFSQRAQRQAEPDLHLPGQSGSKFDPFWACRNACGRSVG